MAVTKTITDIKLRIQTSVSEGDTVKTKSYTFSHVAEGATGDQLYAAGTAIASLLAHPAQSVSRIEEAVLEEEV